MFSLDSTSVLFPLWSGHQWYGTGAVGQVAGSTHAHIHPFFPSPNPGDFAAGSKMGASGVLWRVLGASHLHSSCFSSFSSLQFPCWFHFPWVPLSRERSLAEGGKALDCSRSAALDMPVSESTASLCCLVFNVMATAGEIWLHKGIR